MKLKSVVVDETKPVVVSLSLPGREFREVEEGRRSTGESRSAFVSRVLQQHRLNAYETAELNNFSAKDPEVQGLLRKIKLIYDTRFVEHSLHGKLLPPEASSLLPRALRFTRKK